MQKLHMRRVATKLSLSVIYVHIFDQSCGLSFDGQKGNTIQKQLQFLDEIFMGENDWIYAMEKWLDYLKPIYKDNKEFCSGFSHLFSIN